MRPLLCTDEFNILTSGSSPGRDFNSVAFRRAVLDKNVGSFGDKVDGNHDAFLEHIEKRNWMLWGFSVGPFAAFQLPVQRETLGTLTFLHRAEIDHDYQSKLSSSGFIDDEMVKDILAIDFTRSIFSEERCDLVSVFDQIDPGQFVNDGGVVDGAADLMRTALIAELQGATEQHKVDFLANLEESGTDPKAKVADMMVACNAREAADVQTDYLDYIGNTTMRASHHESAMEHVEASFLHFRFPGMRGFAMPDIMGQEFVHGLRFDPTTCLLINNYPGANPVVDEPEEPQAPEEPTANDPGESSCKERGCSFDEGFSCQCDAGCKEFGDCCDFDGDDHDGPAASCE